MTPNVLWPSRLLPSTSSSKFFFSSAEPGVGERCYYSVLGLRQGASQADIRAAFIRLSKLHHPDLAGPFASDSQLSFIAINEAYQCLKKEETVQTIHLD